MMKYNILLEEAKEASKKAYAPYSEFRVGAALLTRSGKVYKGANIENGSFGATVCAERSAFLKAVFEGERQFEAIAVFSPNRAQIVPCGICLQTMQEFCDGDFVIVGENGELPLSKFLPHGFKL